MWLDEHTKQCRWDGGEPRRPALLSRDALKWTVCNETCKCNDSAVCLSLLLKVNVAHPAVDPCWESDLKMTVVNLMHSLPSSVRCASNAISRYLYRLLTKCKMIRNIHINKAASFCPEQSSFFWACFVCEQHEQKTSKGLERHIVPTSKALFKANIYSLLLLNNKTRLC